MSTLPKLGAVVNFGVGYDTTDVEAAASRGNVDTFLRSGQLVTPVPMPVAAPGERMS